MTHINYKSCFELYVIIGYMAATILPTYGLYKIMKHSQYLLYSFFMTFFLPKTNIEYRSIIAGRHAPWNIRQVIPVHALKTIRQVSMFQKQDDTLFISIEDFQ